MPKAHCARKSGLMVATMGDVVAGCVESEP